MSFSSLDLYYLVKELQDLINTRISQVYHPEKHVIILEIYSARTGKKFLKFTPGLFLEIIEEKQSAEKPSGFCMFLRKYLANAKIIKIEQRGFDRIIEVTLKQHDETYILISEFFPKGNFLITKKDYEILQCLEVQEWNGRILKPKETYKSPKPPLNPLELSQSKVQEIIKFSDKENIVKTLAINFSLGGEYAETILSLANIKKEQKTLSEKEVKQIYKTLQSIKNNKPNKIIKQEKINQKEKVSQAEIERQKEIQSLKNILQIQNKKIKELEHEEETERKKADMLYENYEESENAIKNNQKEIWFEIKRTSPEHSEELHSQAKDKSANKIKIILDSKQSLVENAALYYEIAKKAKKKIEGAIEALLETQNKIKALETSLMQLKEKQNQQQKETKEKRKLEWYEKYHWFFSSDNFLCIGGKDAVSNEIIVKRYAEKNELVFHTESPGSPFFIIKNPGNKEIPKTTLEETAQATASYSQTWKTNLSTEDVFYVKPEQLTKEFGVQKGMFIIRGEKNIIKPILKLAITNVNNQIIAGPVAAIKSHSTNFLTIIQGDLTKNELAKKIKSKLGGNLEEIERMLPNGKSKIEK